MKLARLIEIVGQEPVFETGFLLAGAVDADDVRKQLSRWAAAGRIYQLRRGLYALAPPYQKVSPHPFLIANRMGPGSYVSQQSALAFFGLIPEQVPVTTSVGPGRPGRYRTPLGTFAFAHLKSELLCGYCLVEVGEGQQAFVAQPEKALLDLVYLQPGSDSPSYLAELRLQNLGTLDRERLDEFAVRAGGRKLKRAAAWLKEQAAREAEEYETL